MTDDSEVMTNRYALLDTDDYTLVNKTGIDTPEDFEVISTQVRLNARAVLETLKRSLGIQTDISVPHNSEIIVQLIKEDDSWTTIKKKPKNPKTKRTKTIVRYNTRAICTSEKCEEYNTTSHIMKFVKTQPNNQIIVMCRYCDNTQTIDMTTLEL